MDGETATYEYWGDVESGVVTLVSTKENIEAMKVAGMVEPELTHLYSVRSDSWTEVMMIRNENNGWGTYKPMED